MITHMKRYRSFHQGGKVLTYVYHVRQRLMEKDIKKSTRLGSFYLNNDVYNAEIFSIYSRNGGELTPSRCI